MIIVLKADVYHYNALSDGIKKTYTNDDELVEYGSRGILDPNQVSYYNLYINGVLQAKANYHIQEGLLTLKTEDLPLKGSTIIITFVTFKDQAPRKLNSAIAEISLPYESVSIGPVTDMDINIQDRISDQLHLEQTILCGPEYSILGQLNNWQFSLTLANTSDRPIRDIVVRSDLLLDSLVNIQALFLSKGRVLIDRSTISWQISLLNPGQSATACFSLDSLFMSVGIRYIARSFALGLDRETGDLIRSEISSSKSILVIYPIYGLMKYYSHLYRKLWLSQDSKIIDFPGISGSAPSSGINIEKHIISGPVDVKADEVNSWIFEIKLSNNSPYPLSRVLIEDSLFLDSLNEFDLISINEGDVDLEDKLISWNIECLYPNRTVVMLAEVSGSFTNDGSCILLGESYQYNTVSDGTREYANNKELFIYGNMGIPDPEDTTFINLFINGVLQPKANYRVDPGLLTLLSEDLPQIGVPIILDYLIMKDKNNKLLKAEVYQFNAYSNTSKIYTDADEITMYGNSGIPDPNNLSYENLFINGVIQPKVNYRIQEGILTLEVEDAPIEGAPITLQCLTLLS